MGRIFITAVLLFFSFQETIFSQSVLLTDDISEHKVNNTHIKCLYIPGKSLSLEEALKNLNLFVDAKDDKCHISGDYIDAWFQFTVNNHSSHQNWVLLISEINLLEVEFYSRTKDGQWIRFDSGITKKIEDRQITTFLHAFYLSNEKDSDVSYFLRAKKRAYLIADIAIMTEKAFNLYADQLQILIGMFAGIAIMMMVVNFAAYVFTKEWTFLIYVFTLLFNDLILMNSIQFDQVFFPAYSAFFVHFKSLFLPLATLLVFAKIVMSVNASHKYINRLFWGLIVLMLLFELARPFMGPLLFRNLQMVSFVIAVGIMILTALYFLVMKKSKFYLLAIIAWLPYYSSVCSIYLANFGIIHENGKFINFAFMSIMVEHIAMSVMVLLKWRDEKKLNEIAFKERDRYKLKVYQNRLKPHFLYNALNTIYAMTYSESNRIAGKTILQLAEIYRYIQGDAMKEKVPLKAEIEFVHRFLYFMKQRKSGLKYKIRIPGSTNTIFVPPMIVQPLIENCIKHGMKERETLFISISLEKSPQGGCKIVVEDDGPGMSSTRLNSATFIGIEERIRSLYETVSVSAQKLLPHGTKISLVFDNLKNIK